MKDVSDTLNYNRLWHNLNITMGYSITMQQIQFQIVKTNDIYTTIKCVECGKMKEITLDGDEIQILNEYCHYCKKEGVLPVQ